MKYFKFVLLAALITLTSGFSACSSMGGPSSDVQKIETACASVTTAVQGLTVANQQGKLTPAQKNSVLHALSVTTPICTAENPPTMDDLKMQAVDAAVAELRTRMSEL